VSAVEDRTPQMGRLRYSRIKGVVGAEGEREIKVAYRGEYPSAADGPSTLYRSARLVEAVNVEGKKITLKDTTERGSSEQESRE